MVVPETTNFIQRVGHGRLVLVVQKSKRVIDPTGWAVADVFLQLGDLQEFRFCLHSNAAH